MIMKTSTETITSDYKDLDNWSLEKTLETIIKSNEGAVQAVQQALPQLTQAAEGIKAQLLKGGRMIYLGAGTSGRLAVQDATELGPTFDFTRVIALLAGGLSANETATEEAEDNEEAARKELEHIGVSAKDAVIGVAASGHTRYTIAGIELAKAKGAFTVAIANNPDTPLLHAADVGVLLETGPEVLAGSTRLAAGTAQKIALNALSTSVLVQLGGAYQNMMVGMRPKNKKLRERAAVIVAQACQVSLETARESLEKAQWRIREAIVMVKRGCSLAEAESLLAKHNNRVRDALVDK
jgi:N-acetylmuramic acid 6-phosphate etherase